MGIHSVSYPVQEFMLKNDTLKNGMSHIGLYGSDPPGVVFIVQTKICKKLTANAGRTAL